MGAATQTRGADSGRIYRERQPAERGAQPSQSDRDRGSVPQYGDRNQSRDRSRDPQYGNNQQYRDRSRDQRYGNHQQYRDRDGRYDRNRSYGHNRGYDNRSYGRYDRGSRSSMFREGRVHRITHEHGGYRVWLSGFGYPFWIPEARWHRWPLRVGVSIRIGGWWDPVGYYNVYDVGPMGYYSAAGDIHGIVETVDYRRGTLVLRDDISRGFVTVLLRGRDRRLYDLRPGDYVDLSGRWTRGGIFEAYDLEALRDGDYGDRWGY